MDEIKQFWGRLPPDVRAAVVVGVAIIVLEVITDVLPGFGHILVLPVALTAYYLQGVLTAWWARQDERYANLGRFMSCASLGLKTAFWTSVVLSTVVMVINIVILTPLSLGGTATLIPFIFSGSLADWFLNSIFAVLGAWMYVQMGGKGLLKATCLVLGLGTLLSCLLMVGLMVGLGWAGYAWLWPELKQLLP
jgi:hypothetical protein